MTCTRKMHLITLRHTPSIYVNQTANLDSLTKTEQQGYSRWLIQSSSDIGLYSLL